MVHGDVELSKIYPVLFFGLIISLAKAHEYGVTYQKTQKLMQSLFDSIERHNLFVSELESIVNQYLDINKSLQEKVALT